jgi:DNA-binding NarL/FixJ family response regulator
MCGTVRKGIGALDTLRSKATAVTYCVSGADAIFRVRSSKRPRGDTTMIRLMIVDDHIILRKGICRLLSLQEDLTVLADESNYGGAVSAACRLEIDLVVLELTLAGRDGFELIHHLRKIRPEMRILGMSSRSEPAIVLRALRAGFDGYTDKVGGIEELLTAIRVVAAGTRHVCPRSALQIALGVALDEPRATSLARLSDREHRVFELIAEGKRGFQIADELSLSAKTISTHKTNILRKLQIKRGSELLAYAAQHQMLLS